MAPSAFKAFVTHVGPFCLQCSFCFLTMCFFLRAQAPRLHRQRPPLGPRVRVPAQLCQSGMVQEPPLDIQMGGINSQTAAEHRHVQEYARSH